MAAPHRFPLWGGEWGREGRKGAGGAGPACPPTLGAWGPDAGGPGQHGEPQQGQEWGRKCGQCELHPSRPSPKPWQGLGPGGEAKGQLSRRWSPAPPCLPEDDQNVPSDKTQDRQEPQILAGDGEGEWSLVVRPDKQQLPLDLETAFCSMFRLEVLLSLIQKKTELPVTDHLLSPVMCPASCSSPCRNMKKVFHCPFLLQHRLYPQWLLRGGEDELEGPVCLHAQSGYQGTSYTEEVVLTGPVLVLHNCMVKLLAHTLQCPCQT